MTKSVTEAALDAAFDYIADRADQMALCEGAPAAYADAATPKSSGGRMIATAPLTEGVGGGDFTVANGVLSGRRLVVAARSQVSASETGTIDHLALLDTGAGAILAVTELTEPLALTPGQIIGVRSFSQEIAAPV